MKCTLNIRVHGQKSFLAGESSSCKNSVKNRQQLVAIVNTMQIYLKIV